MKDVWMSEIPVPVLGFEVIPNVYDEIIKYEKCGCIRIRRYETLSEEEKEKRHHIIVKAIYMERLLHSFPEKAAFVKEKFQKAWKQAYEHPEKEEEIINNWKKQQ